MSIPAKLSHIPLIFKISFFPLSSTHCIVTHLSASDSFSTMALYKFIYLLTYLFTYLMSGINAALLK